MATMTPTQRLQRAHIQLMNSKEFCLLSGVLMCGENRIKDGVPTAYTDGWNAYYGEKFMEKLTEKELIFLVAHENMHKMLKQLTIWKSLFKENASRANQAADYCINYIIARELDPYGRLTSIPEGGLLDDTFAGMSTKEIYDFLKQNGNSPKRGKGEPGDGDGDGDGEADGLDEHGWEEADGVPDKEAKARGDQIDRAIEQGKIIAGKRGSGGSRMLDELTAPKVDWREQLRDFVTSTANNRDLSTWRKPNRRWLAQGVYMPSMYSEAIGDMVVAIDTSGSIGGTQLAEFVSELVGICETVAPSKVHLLWWDTQVARHQKFGQGDYSGLASALKPAGGGGTSFSCVGKYMDEKGIHPEVVVALTDGYVSDWGDPLNAPTLFAITSKQQAPFGVSINLN